MKKYKLIQFTSPNLNPLTYLFFTFYLLGLISPLTRVTDFGL